MGSWIWEHFPGLFCWFMCKVMNILSPHNNLPGGACALGHFPIPVFLLYLTLTLPGISSKPLDFLLLQP